MSEPIHDLAYWRERLLAARQREIHRAVFDCDLERWQRIEAKHREVLARLILPTDSLLDAGCGWGRLLSLLPAGWDGRYVGIDLSPDFVELAKQICPSRAFILGSLETVQQRFPPGTRFDWAILISIQPMIVRHMGADAWERMHGQIASLVGRILYLEYDEHGEGSIEECA